MSMTAPSRIGSLQTIGTGLGSRHLGRDTVDDHVIDVYNYATRAGAISAASLELVALQLNLPVPAVSAAISRLVELHLLRADDERSDRLVPMDAKFAASLLISPLERSISQQRELAEQQRRRIDTAIGPRSADAGSAGTIDSFEGEHEISQLLVPAAQACRNEVLILRPDHSDDEVVERLFDGCFSALDRGVKVRLLTPHRSRADFGSRAKARRMIDRGADIRTVSHLPQASVVFDRSLALMFPRPEDGFQPTARTVHDGNVVRFLIDMFDQMWDGAAPFASEEPGYAEDVADDLQRAIARLMAQGLTDEVVARRLGMSIRTCRRHIAALLRNLNSVSRFQAGVQAAHRLPAEDALEA